METDFSAKEDPIAFLNNIKTDRIAIKKTKIHKKIFINTSKMIRRGNKTDLQKKNCCQILICFLMEEMMLSNL